ncbi:NAD(P)-dependent oxidoreductase [Deinococcus peraridilitoris]|uniref:Putative NADH-flavin reductase n=1 Tax=Deinococcus peraridilitoris (strain DSM 19664 / LMG 22246 / CIP 109416 / KR-200) TaxID=937777 RepID=L0A0F9_DEIPD|nr:NAD(P)-dependent oxidoreductase [Deinococcus peraridilitoris]AFZ67331.1 putative NADH-flavin reductase [Deinococcus peraridilitoris DSM 19664]
MKILLIGASGFVGGRILQEALNRSHEVTALVRRAGTLSEHAHLRTVHGDATDTALLTQLAREHDAIILSVTARKPGDTPVPEVARAVMQSVKSAATTRLFVVGGAGSLEVAPGLALIDTPEFPQEYKAEAQQSREVLQELRTSELNWTYLSPAIEIAPGERTASFRTGGDTLMTDGQGRSFISAEDYAVAVLNELEGPRHERRRFSVAY